MAAAQQGGTLSGIKGKPCPREVDKSNGRLEVCPRPAVAGPVGVVKGRDNRCRSFGSLGRDQTGDIGTFCHHAHGGKGGFSHQCHRYEAKGQAGADLPEAPIGHGSEGRGSAQDGTRCPARSR